MTLTHDLTSSITNSHDMTIDIGPDWASIINIIDL